MIEDENGTFASVLAFEWKSLRRCTVSQSTITAAAVAAAVAAKATAARRTRTRTRKKIKEQTLEMPRLLVSTFFGKLQSASLPCPRAQVSPYPHLKTGTKWHEDDEVKRLTNVGGSNCFGHGSAKLRFGGKMLYRLRMMSWGRYSHRHQPDRTHADERRPRYA